MSENFKRHSISLLLKMFVLAETFTLNTLIPEAFTAVGRSYSRYTYTLSQQQATAATAGAPFMMEPSFYFVYCCTSKIDEEILIHNAEKRMELLYKPLQMIIHTRSYILVL